MHPLLALTVRTVPLWARIGLAVIAGLMVGSFLNVVVYRVPRAMSISSPRSFCPRCRRQLAWWENVPVGSWIVLGGRCRTCRAPISPRYPLVEAGSAAAFGLVASAFDGSLLTVAYCLLAATLVAVGMIDAGDLRSPLGLAASGTAAADVSLAAATWWHSQWAVLLGAQAGLVIGIGCFALLRALDPQCRHKSGIGRSALIPLGCWLGGLGLDAALWGTGSALVLFFGLTVVAPHQVVTSVPGASSGGSIVHHALSRPLLGCIGVAAAVSLMIAH